eukprot:m.90655 g.90655  ORF g.90655 m.90655 type:complete len:340 (-) comp12308_c0_seq1:219-1238(-)
MMILTLLTVTLLLLGDCLEATAVPASKQGNSNQLLQQHMETSTSSEVKDNLIEQFKEKWEAKHEAEIIQESHSNPQNEKCNLKMEHNKKLIELYKKPEKNSPAWTTKAGSHWNDGDVCLLSRKALDECDSDFVYPLLVTGVGRSGTHFTAYTFSQMGLQFIHEGTRLDGGVGWPYAVYNNTYVWEHERVRNGRFAFVAHLVRHPLKTIASLTTYKEISWEFIAAHTPQVPNLDKIVPIERRALIHWVTWNRMIATYADKRYSLSVNTPKTICEDAGFLPHYCNRGESSHAKKYHRDHTLLTWDDLFAMDGDYAYMAMQLAMEYGFHLDPLCDNTPPPGD